MPAVHANPSPKPTAPMPTMPAASATGSRLRGPWLVAARGGWWVIFIAVLAWFITFLPEMYITLSHPTSESIMLPPPAVAALTRIGITVTAYAWIILTILCAITFASASIALVLFLRRGDDWLALLISLFLVFYPVSSFGGSSVSTSGSLAEQALSLALFIPHNAIFYAPFLLFPSGRFVPRWSWALLIAWVAWSLAFAYIPSPLGDVLAIGYPFFYGFAIACQIYRYRRATSTERQQVKWIVFGLVITLFVNQAFWLPTAFTPLGQTLYAPFAALVYQSTLLLVPVTFFIAIQRYRLFDIDVIINRALVYGSLTAILALVYVAGVIGSQAIVGSLTHMRDQPQSPISIVATTLVIAALFNPLRRRLQAFIDRRFYRRKYDAARTLAAFGTALRDEVDLDDLTGHLLAVVAETMQPAHLSLWLRREEHGRGG